MSKGMELEMKMESIASGRTEQISISVCGLRCLELDEILVLDWKNKRDHVHCVR